NRRETVLLHPLEQRVAIIPIDPRNTPAALDQRGKAEGDLAQRGRVGFGFTGEVFFDHRQIIWQDAETCQIERLSAITTLGISTRIVTAGSNGTSARP